MGNISSTLTGPAGERAAKWMFELAQLPNGDTLFPEVIDILKNGSDNGLDLMLKTRSENWLSIESKATSDNNFNKIDTRSLQIKGGHVFTNFKLRQLAEPQARLLKPGSTTKFAKIMGRTVTPEVSELATRILREQGRTRFKSYVLGIRNIYQRKPHAVLFNWTDNVNKRITDTNRRLRNSSTFRGGRAGNG